MKAVVSYVTKGRDDYPSMAMNLIDSLDGLDADIFIFNPDRTINHHWAVHREPEPSLFTFKKHSEVPYQFKYACIQELREAGYEQIIWLDSSMRLVNHKIYQLFVQPVICFDNLGHPLKNYISDDAVRLLNADISIPQIWGGALGFDFTNPKTQDIWDEIITNFEAMKDGGSDRNGFIAHRHDQAVLSVILNRHNIKPYPYGFIVCKPHDQTKEYGEHFYIVYGR